MKLGLGFNPIVSVRDAMVEASRADALGYDSVWMHESLYQRDVVTYISAMASSTAKIMLGSGVINTFTRHPVTAATTFATLSELSGGRVILGLGLGSFPTIPLIGHRIFPVGETKPIRRIREYVEVVKRTWAGERVEFDGDFFQVHGLTMGFEPARKIPIFVGSLSPKIQAFAATVADGVILSPALATPRGTEAMVENVKRGEARQGRGVERASYLLTSVDRDPARAAKAVKDYYFFAYQLSEVVDPETLSPYGVTEEDLSPLRDAWRRGDQVGAKRLIPEEAVEALTVTGTPDHAIERIDEYRKAGVTLPILMPIGDVGCAVNELAPKG